MKNKLKKILIFGGSGYVGSSLINYLLKKKYTIINYDKDLFGNKHLPFKNKNFFHINGDLRDTNKIYKIFKKFSVEEIIHLGCISNDPSYLLNKKLSKEINYESFKDVVKIAKNSGVNKFIFASTCSVYGVSSKKNVRENSPLKPITLYNKYKAMCEPILLDSLNSNFQGCIIRPATVCGVSPKMRFDLTVNILTNYAYNKGFIRVFGGSQKRPNIHIDEIVRIYGFLIKENFAKFNGEVFNAGFENLKIIEIAKKVKKIVEAKKKTKIDIYIEKSNDLRSYHINSDKLKKVFNFTIKKKVEDAIEDICNLFKSNKLKDSFTNLNYYNVKKLNKINFK